MAGSQIIFWFSILAIVSTVVSIVLVLIAPPGKRPPWLIFFVFHIGAYTALLIGQSFVFFSVILMEGNPVSIARPAEPIYLLISSIILLTYPPFIFKLTAGAGKQGAKALVFAFPLFLLMLVLSFFLRQVYLSIALNFLVNSYLLGFSIFGFLKSRNREASGLRAAMHSFLRVAMVLYAVLIMSIPLAFVIPPERFPDASMLFTALFCFSWSFFMIRELLRNHERPLNRGIVGEAFITDYRISGRERDVLEKLIEGKTNKAIADELFISTRTVETHIYKIYRKTGVTNKVELLRLLENT